MKANLFRLLRVIAILMMGITVALTLLGAVGTTCAAFGPENFESMLPLAPYKGLYQALVVISLAAGVAGIRALVGLARSAPRAYRETLLVLAVAGAAALIQVIASRFLRGKSMPTDVRLYATALTLALVLLLRIPGVWQQAAAGGSSKPAAKAGGAAALVVGALALTVHLWAAPTHTFGGINFADAFHLPITASGWGLVAGGAALLIYGFSSRSSWAARAFNEMLARLGVPNGGAALRLPRKLG